MEDETGYSAHFEEPSLIFYSHHTSHWFDAPKGADLVCAHVRFAHASINPIVLAIPDRFQCSLKDLPKLDTLLNLLFSEAETEEPGHKEVLNRLFELVLIHLVRICIERGTTDSGLIRGLSDPQISRALSAIHESPQHPWSLDDLAREAGMSRSAFAARFHAELGQTPFEYLTQFRVMTAQVLLRQGHPLKYLAEEVGYTTRAGLIKAFRSVTGFTPGKWARQQQ